MPQSLSKVMVHLIFSTKHREPLIPKIVLPRLHGHGVGSLGRIEWQPTPCRRCALAGHGILGWTSPQGGCPGLMSPGALGADRWPILTGF
jgi:hypothetical protein